MRGPGDAVWCRRGAFPVLIGYLTLDLVVCNGGIAVRSLSRGGRCCVDSVSNLGESVARQHSASCRRSSPSLTDGHQYEGDAMRLKQSALLVGTTIFLLGGTGCSSGTTDTTDAAVPEQEMSSTGGSVAVLDREATAEDQLPDFVSDIVVGDNDTELNADSVRKAVERDGLTYYLGSLNDGESLCVYSTTSDDFIGGCGTSGGKVTTVAPGEGSNLNPITLVTDDYSTATLEQDGWTKIHDNILIG